MDHDDPIIPFGVERRQLQGLLSVSENDALGSHL